jgi:hypothetical protein
MIRAKVSCLAFAPKAFVQAAALADGDHPAG